MTNLKSSNGASRPLKAIEKGDYDQATDLLGEAVAIDRQAIEDQQDTLDRRKLSAATTLGQQGELERIRLNYRKAAEHFAEAAALMPASETDTRFDHLMGQASVLRDQGDEFGDNAALSEAIGVYPSILEEWTQRARAPPMGQSQNSLGIAPQDDWPARERNGKARDGGRRYQAALEEFTREARPRMGQGPDESRQRAQEPLASARVEQKGSIKPSTPAKQPSRNTNANARPSKWARAQNNLGSALWALGERENRTERLELAVNAYRAALEEFTRERTPLEWAGTQMNLGNAFWTLGERESGTERLEQATIAHRAALEEFTRERMPLDWARTQSNLGNALTALGERKSGTEKLELAVNAYRAALEEFTRERMPLDWARTQLNLGAATPQPWRTRERDRKARNGR